MRKDFEIATQKLDLAQQFAERMENTRGLTAIMYRRAANLVAQGRLDDAEPILIQSIYKNSIYGESRHIADNKLLLATLYQRTGRYSAAQQMVKDSQEIYHKIGMPSSFEYAKEFYEKLSSIESHNTIGD